ncbi:hypothetical protein BD311DRAFT_782444 [Dichomitus squalens]|uniref:Uncharacterized protein n=1 Tax=Dichomitus squalens TaxID=114155 RepID=A0A4V2JYS5_9APHY|nr:hypothetical protein BD311DRAFT_782444 [Dichomitus squalens]
MYLSGRISLKCRPPFSSTQSSEASRATQSLECQLVSAHLPCGLEDAALHLDRHKAALIIEGHEWKVQQLEAKQDQTIVEHALGLKKVEPPIWFMVHVLSILSPSGR